MHGGGEMEMAPVRRRNKISFAANHEPSVMRVAVDAWPAPGTMILRLHHFFG